MSLYLNLVSAENVFFVNICRTRLAWKRKTDYGIIVTIKKKTQQDINKEGKEEM